MRFLRIRFLRHRLLFLVLGASLTPCVAAAGIAGFFIAQSLPLDAASQLGDKNLAYWFLAAAGVAITSWTWFARLLLQQLENQRTVNSALNAQLIDFMARDHADMRSLVARTTEVIAIVLQKLGHK